jgi:hypothetical protein
MNPVPIVGVGSIQHILKTAFVNIYDEEKSMQDAQNEKKAQKIMEQEEKAAAAAVQLAIELEEAELNEKKNKKPQKRGSAEKVDDIDLNIAKGELSIVENLGTIQFTFVFIISM